jgi:aldose 1-epimerase
MSSVPVVLRREDLTVILDPAQGGAVREFSKHGLHLFRPTPPQADEDPFLFACFPMVPFANRIANGRFIYSDREIQIPPNWTGDPHPIHGQAWRATWNLHDLSASRAELVFQGGGDAWPWLYRCEQVFDLRPDGLNVTLLVQNLATTPMPATIGLHPYFADAQHARLEAHLPRVWRTEGNLAVENVATPDAWRFEPSRQVATLSLDHSFSDWPGIVDITWPDRRLQMRAINCRHLHIYTPAGRDFFCVEPQTAAAGALNRGGNEVAILGPKARLAIQVDFAIGVA